MFECASVCAVGALPPSNYVRCVSCHLKLSIGSSTERLLLFRMMCDEECLPTPCSNYQLPDSVVKDIQKSAHYRKRIMNPDPHLFCSFAPEQASKERTKEDKKSSS